MANITRTIQFKRNQTASLNAAEAKQRIIAQESNLSNGEFIINSYMDSNSPYGIANILGIKAQDKLFFIDNQTILNALGIKDDGTENPNITDGAFQRIDALESGNTALDALVDRIITAAGLKPDDGTTQGGTYIISSDKHLSGATSLADADEELAYYINRLEEFVGIDDAGGDSLVDRIAAISGKSITQVENTNSIAFTKEEASDGTQKIKADVKRSAQSGNVILEKEDGIYTEVDYNPTTNALIVNGVEKPINAGSIIDSIEYSADTESLVINYSDTSGGTHSTSAPLKDLIEEYDFDESGSTDYNVVFKVTRNVSGATTVQADVHEIDCGEY